VAAISVSQGDTARGKALTNEPIGAIDHLSAVNGPVPAGFSGVFHQVSPTGDPPAAKLQTSGTTAHSTNEAAPSREQSEGIFATQLDGAPRTLTASPTELEVGIPNGMHGWLRVRAEITNGGSVNASVSVTSPVAREILHRELPSLTAYLQEEKVSVNTIVVHAPLQSAVEQRSSAGADAGGGQAAQSGNDGGEGGQHASKTASADEAGVHRSVPGFEEDGSLHQGTHSAGGSWLSVRA
jgi:hypothetical protein